MSSIATDSSYLDSRPTSMPSWWRPGVAMIGLGAISLASGEAIGRDQWWVPGALIIASGLVLLPTIRRALRRRVQEVLADHLLVLAGAFMAYYVFGALLIPFGPQDQADYSLSYYWLDAPLAMRVTAVNNIGFGLALISGSLTGRRLVSRLARTAGTLGRKIAQEWVIAMFLLVGGASSLYVLAFDIGLLPGVVSGLLRTMSMLLLVAIMVSAAHRGRGSVWLLASAIVLTVIQASGGLLLLNKSSVLLPMMALLAGLAWRLGIRRVMVPGLAVLIVVFLLIGNPVNTARNIYGLGDRPDWSERISVLWEGLFHSIEGDDYPHWARFSYLSPQGAALDFYDTGRGGDDYDLLGWVFLPRFLFPDKPIITASGREFHFKITGYDTSSAGHGVFVNGYYNLGWWGVVFVGIAVGCILAWTSALAAQVFRAGALLWLPMPLLGSYMAFRIDGTFVADYWGPFVLLGYTLLASVALKSLFQSASRR